MKNKRTIVDIVGKKERTLILQGIGPVDNGVDNVDTFRENFC